MLGLGSSGFQAHLHVLEDLIRLCREAAFSNDIARPVYFSFLSFSYYCVAQAKRLRQTVCALLTLVLYRRCRMAVYSDDSAAKTLLALRACHGDDAGQGPNEHAVLEQGWSCKACGWAYRDCGARLTRFNIQRVQSTAAIKAIDGVPTHDR